MNRKKVIFVVLMIFCLAFTGCSNKKEDKNRYTGTIECESYYVTSEIAGKLNKLSVEQGSSVKNADSIAQIDTQRYKFEKDKAEGVLQSAQAKYDSIPDGADENIKNQSKGAINQAKAAVNLAKFNISKGDVKSLKSGIVTDVFVHEGEMVQTGTNIIKIMDIENKYIKIYLEESKRHKVKLQDVLNVYYKGKKVAEGKVVYISPESEFTPKNTQTKEEKEDTVFQIKIKFLENNSFSPGTLLDVEVK
ncbi:HlyD family secretion protein [Haloimpatiens sp. FM7330]|uniref:HlyD family secretion protein n=1 Tax=Haloimpatiens sp. FM7330 TaxID=3298610 RepID=UPI0036371024